MRLAAGLVLTAALAAASELTEAVRGDDRTRVEALLKSGAKVNECEEDGASALAWAAVRSNVEVARRLLRAGADPNLANEPGITPLAIAISNGSAELAILLLEHRADPNRARENGESPLMIAARLGRVDIMKALLAKGADVNASEKKFGQTALMWAAGNSEAVTLLLRSGADWRRVTKSWDVTYTNYLPTTVTLGKTGIPWNNDGTYAVKKGGLSALHFAVQKNDLASVRLLLDAGAPVDAPTADGTTPLLAALYKWDRPKSTFIPGKGAPATAGSSQQFHPNLAIASLLLDRGASVKVRDGSGYTPLHGASLTVAKAARTGSRLKGAYGGSAAALALGSDEDAALKLDDALVLVERLLKAGADANQQTIHATGGPAGDVRINPAPAGSSSMHIAASSGSVALVKLLAAHGGNPNLLRNDGHTPFSVSVLAGDVAVVKQLAESGAEVKGRWSPRDKIPDPVEAITLARENQTALHLAAIEGKPELLTYLHSIGVPFDAKNSMDETPLDLADKQERYRFAIQVQGVDGDVEKIKKIVRKTDGTDCLKKLAAK